MQKTMPPYFHVVAWIKPAAGIARLLHHDLSEDALNRAFLAPYRAGKRTVIDGDVIDLREIESVKIVRTDISKDEALKELQNRSLADIDELNRMHDDVVVISGGYGWTDEEIAGCGRDVTAEYIKGAPGEHSLLSQMFSHPWVVGIGTAVAAGLILLLLGVAG